MWIGYANRVQPVDIVALKQSLETLFDRPSLLVILMGDGVFFPDDLSDGATTIARFYPTGGIGGTAFEIWNDNETVFSLIRQESELSEFTI